jgi:two-component system alkaline phosphatase synthesis response regulator PhoP/two-component system response regulator VicR
MAKILVVDDDEEIIRVVQIPLEAQGYDVVSAYNGLQALQHTARELPDLIVLDVAMPEMDGLTVLEHLKGNPSTAHIPVIMLSAKDQVSDISRGWNSGADFYWTKPFNAIQLSVLVKRILDEKLA